MPANPELDKLLEQAIDAYANVQPLSGIEARIVARIRTSQPPSRRPRRIAIPISVTAAAAIAIFLFAPRLFSPEPQPFVLPVAPPTLAATRPPLQHAPEIPRARAVSASTRKRNAVPTLIPPPVTREEHLLLVLVRNNPKDAALAFDTMRQYANQQIDIPPLTITPLPTDVNQ